MFVTSVSLHINDVFTYAAKIDQSIKAPRNNIANAPAIRYFTAPLLLYMKYSSILLATVR